MNIGTSFSNYSIALSLTIAIVLFVSCKDDTKSDSLAGPTSVGDSLYVVVVDANGNPINNGSIFYTCWVPSAPGQPNNDCKASVFVNSSGLKKDTTTKFSHAPSPSITQTITFIENEKTGNVDFTIYNYEKTKRLLTLTNGKITPGQYSFEASELDNQSTLPYSYAQQASTNGIYWFQLKRDYDTTTYWSKLLVFDRTKPMYKTNMRGYVPISYNSLPFGEQILRVAENGIKLGTFIPQGDYLYVKCSADGYKPNYGLINAYERKDHILKVVLEKE